MRNVKEFFCESSCESVCESFCGSESANPSVNPSVDPSVVNLSGECCRPSEMLVDISRQSSCGP